MNNNTTITQNVFGYTDRFSARPGESMREGRWPSRQAKDSGVPPSHGRSIWRALIPAGTEN